MLSVTRAIEYGLEMFAHDFKLIGTDAEGVVHAGWVKGCTTMDRFTTGPMKAGTSVSRFRRRVPSMNKLGHSL